MEKVESALYTGCTWYDAPIAYSIKKKLGMMKMDQIKSNNNYLK